MMKRFLFALAVLLPAALPASAQVVISGGAIGGSARTILTSSSATTCTAIKATGGRLVALINTGAAMTVYPEFFDDDGTCAAGDLIYGNGSSVNLGLGQVVLLNIPTYSGISYTLSGALTANLVVTFY